MHARAPTDRPPSPSYVSILKQGGEKLPLSLARCVQIVAPRCPRRPPACLAYAWPGHRGRRQNSQQRKTGSYTDGSAGRHQLATLPSSSVRGATFDGTERGHVVGTLTTNT